MHKARRSEDEKNNKEAIDCDFLHNFSHTKNTRKIQFFALRKISFLISFSLIPVALTSALNLC